VEYTGIFIDLLINSAAGLVLSHLSSLTQFLSKPIERWDWRYRLLKTKAKQNKTQRKTKAILLESLTLPWSGTGESTHYAGYFIAYNRR